MPKFDHGTWIVRCASTFHVLAGLVQALLTGLSLIRVLGLIGEPSLGVEFLDLGRAGALSALHVGALTAGRRPWAYRARHLALLTIALLAWGDWSAWAALVLLVVWWDPAVARWFQRSDIDDLLDAADAPPEPALPHPPRALGVLHTCLAYVGTLLVGGITSRALDVVTLDQLASVDWRRWGVLLGLGVAMLVAARSRPKNWVWWLAMPLIVWPFATYPAWTWWAPAAFLCVWLRAETRRWYGVDLDAVVALGRRTTT